MLPLVKKLDCHILQVRCNNLGREACALPLASSSETGWPFRQDEALLLDCDSAREMVHY